VLKRHPQPAVPGRHRRRTICGCLKNVAARAAGSNDNISKCGVNLPYKISSDVNCNTYVHAANSVRFLLVLFSASVALCSRLWLCNVCALIHTRSSCMNQSATFMPLCFYLHETLNPP
jgi:hypothetical protein